MKTILHVDDEKDTLDLVKLILEKENFRVISVLSGQEGLDALAKEKVDLVLLDIMLPKMSGWEVLKSIQKSYKNVKVIFMSVVRIDPNVLTQLKKDGLVGYLQKPCSNEQIVQTVKRVLA